MAAACTAGPGHSQDVGPCAVSGQGPLPPALDETSGLATSPDGRFWSHNDSGNDAVLYALGPDGRLAERVAVKGARHRDWEDLASGPCDAGHCLYIGDIGDNGLDRDEIRIYRVPVPEPGAGRTGRATELRLRYPDGAHNAEALFMLPSGDAYIVTKGSERDIALYRVPADAWTRESAELERVRPLDAGQIGSRSRDQVTGAAASADGRRVAIRTYITLYIFETTDLLGSGNPMLRVDLRPLTEPQGEAVWLGDDGTVLLTSESVARAPPMITRLSCTFSAGADD